MDRSSEERRPLGGGEYLVRLPEGDDCSFRVEASFDKPGWRPRRAAEATLQEFPGTAVAIEGELYEVVRAEPAATGTGYSYWLRTWDDRHPLRGIVSYDAQQVAREAAGLAARRRSQVVGGLLAVLAPLVGMLPAADQRRLELEHGFSATRGTLLGALLGLGVSFAMLLLGFAQMLSSQGDQGLGWTARAMPVSLFFVLESLVRMWVALQLDQPMGSFPVWLGLGLARAVRGSRRARGTPVDERDERERREMWVETLEPLLGLLDADTQARLAASFAVFEADRATRASILCETVLAGASVLAAGFYLLTDPRPVDALVLLGASLAVLEASARERARRGGSIRGSVAAVLVRPFARRLLE